ncbi:hypothetical protein H5410_027295 [Solanum commersonii]|uniref:RNase H type-1 domain-containing protein n=1 Tax=Solanum commersonii TaxID=4109 RepID=A0A9J5YYP5_SOLCO|nr:hypothetical protein H5410_027295 [Solanum commersonii]
MWKTPPINKYKLNTDDSDLHNLEKIGRGGILRDDQGVLIYAFALPFGEGTNNQADVEANSTVDLLAKQSQHQDIEQRYYTPHQLPQTQEAEKDKATSLINNNLFQNTNTINIKDRHCTFITEGLSISNEID